MNKIAIDPRLPARVDATEGYLTLLNIRLVDLFRSIIAQINTASDGFLSSIKTVTTSYTLGQSDQIILVNNTAPVTITIPKSTDTVNKRFVIKKISNNAHAVTVSAVSGNIDNSATKVISSYLASYELASDGANYWII